MQRKARAGHVTGGRVFGYDNVPVMIAGTDGEPRRSYVERRISEREAAVVRKIFELTAAGRGKTAIAKLLNELGEPAPRAQQGRPRAWCASSVHGIVDRPIYRGELVYDRTKKRNGLAWLQATDRVVNLPLLVTSPTVPAPSRKPVLSVSIDFDGAVHLAA